MMMNRHRSTSRSRSRHREAANEARQPEEDGRSRRTMTPGSPTGGPPRTPRSSASGNAATPPPSAPTTPHSAPPAPPSQFAKTRCYRLNLEKPFDIRNQKSPLGRDYSGPPIRDSDLPPAQGPVEYVPPPHLCSKEEMNWRRHSWGGYVNGANSAMSSAGGATTPSELMANLHVSVSEESTNSAADPTSIAISTARIFRGIVVDRNGVITSMNSRAMRSQRGKEGANKNKMGEKSRQAAKIDKAKDLIDDVDNVGGGGMSDEENDPTKTVSLFIMGEYEELNDLVRDGSKKLRDSKSLADETILSYNRPRQFPAGMHPPSTPTSNMGPASINNASSHYSGAGASSAYDQDATMSPANASATSSSSNLRKRVFSADKSSSRYKQVPRSAPPKLKGHPRDRRSGSSRTRSSQGGGAASPSASQGYYRGSSNMSQSTAVQQQQGGMLNCNPRPKYPPSSQPAAHEDASSSHGGKPHYFQQQCNFFPGNSDWTEALGFSVNSLWNCGANGGHLSPTMSPHSNPSSPRNGGGGGGSAHGGSSQHGAPPVTGGGVYQGSSHAGYGHHQSGYHHHHQPSGGYSGAGYYSSGGSAYRNDVDSRNPSSGYGYGRGSSAGIRDTVVM